MFSNQESKQIGQVMAALLSSHKIVDLTVLISTEYPAGTAIGQPFLQVAFDDYGKNNFSVSGEDTLYRDHILIMNGHTGTHCDVGPHMLPDIALYPDLPHAHVKGAETLEKVEPERWWGPADVIDVTDLVGTVGPGLSPIITVDRVKKWEDENGPIEPGDVVLFYTGWTDLYYKPFPEGYNLDLNCRFYKKTSGWPAPDAPTAQYIMDRGVRCLGFDTVSTGSIQADGDPHWAALGSGAVLVEKLIGLGQLPPRGSYFIFMPIKTEESTGGPGRAVAIV
jgi:kynurenine formamidase